MIIIESILEIFRVTLYIPILNILIFFYIYLGHNLGVAITALTAFSKLILIPLTIPSLKAMVKQRELAPEIADLQKKYGSNKTLLAQKQMELYKKHGFNPASGCLPQIIQLVILIVLYQVLLAIFQHGPSYFNENIYLPFMKFPQDAVFNTRFFHLDLTKKDPYFILPVLAGLTQFALSKISMPTVNKMEKLAEKTPDKKDDVAYNMQKQMIYMMPIMTVFIGISLPSGLVLYWFWASAFALVQQWIMNKKQLKK